MEMGAMGVKMIEATSIDGMGSPCMRLPGLADECENTLTRVKGASWKQKRLEGISERHRARRGRWLIPFVEEPRATPSMS